MKGDLMGHGFQYMYKLMGKNMKFRVILDCIAQQFLQ